MKLATEFTGEMDISALSEVSDAPSVHFDELYARYGAAVLRWTKHLAGPTLDAEDIAQEVFYRAYRTRSAFRGSAHPRTLLYRIAANVVTSRRNSQKRRERLATLLRTDAPSAESTPLEAVEHDERRALIYQVLNSMRERDRTLLIAFGIEGLSGREIAELFNLKLSTVWTWLYRARLDLRRRLVNRGVELETP